MWNIIFWVLGFIAVTIVILYAIVRIKKLYYYRKLLKIQEDVRSQYGDQLTWKAYQASDLPGFDNRIVRIADFLPESTFKALQQEAIQHKRVERNYYPVHKKGGTIAYEELHFSSPHILAFYHAPQLHNVCSAIVGERLVPTPVDDQSSCSLLFYKESGDHIGWHYDYDFYNGRHFTVLIPLVNQHNENPEQLSSAELYIMQNNQEIMVPTPPNTFILFEGQHVYHKVSKLKENETRILLSMTFCTNPKASLVKSTARRIKDTAFFGIRALWT